MIEIRGFNKLAEDVIIKDLMRTQEKAEHNKAIKARRDELTAQGIDRQLADVMSKVFTEYGI